MPVRSPAHWMIWSRTAAVISSRGFRSANPLKVWPRVACICRPRPSTPRCRPRCRRPNTTTRFWALFSSCSSSTPAVPSFWCRKTSTCASRPAPSACLQKTTLTTKYWKIPTCCTQVRVSYPATSGIRTAPAWSRGKKTPRPATASPAPCAGISCSMNLSTTSTNRPSRPSFAKSMVKPPSWKRWSITRTRSTPSGASTPATASRTLPSICSWTRRSTSSPCSARPAPVKRCLPWLLP